MSAAPAGASHDAAVQPVETFLQKRLRIKAERDALANPRPHPTVPALVGVVMAGDARAVRWLEVKLERQLADVAACAEGSRNHNLNAVAYSLGQYIPKWLEEAKVGAALTTAALASGLDPVEVQATIRSGLTAGMLVPKDPPVTASTATTLADLVAPAPSGVDTATGEITSTPAIVPPALDTTGFWDERPVLRHVLTFAQSRMVSPWALLGVSLVRVLAVIPPHVTLPALVGSPGSLNSFVGLVGPSGGGKGAAEGAALEALDVGTVEVHGAGSGEGLLHLYVRRERKQLHQHRTSVLLSVPEVDTLVALKSRQGATLLPILRSAWSGECLAFGYADPDKALKLERHSYRLGMIVGIQPGRAAPLLEDSDGGTPQRFLWLPTTDPDSPDELPATPPQWTVPTHSWFAAGRHELVVPDVARQAVQDNRRRVIRGDGQALDGHALLARLKTAQALALLDGRRDMTEDDWRLSGLVLAISDATRSGVQAYLSQQARSSNLARARSEGERTAVADDVAAEHATQRCGRLIRRHLLTRGELSRSDLRKLLPSRDRRWFDESLEALRTAGVVTVQDSSHGERIALHEADA